MAAQAKTVDRKPQEEVEDDEVNIVFHVYPPVDNDDGGVELDNVVGELCCNLEELAAAGNMSEENLAKYNVITELMATPLCKFEEKCEQLLQDILEEEMTAQFDDTNEVGDTEEEAAENEGMSTVLPNGRSTDSLGTRNTIIPPNDNKPAAQQSVVADDDISDEDLLAEFQAVAVKSKVGSGIYGTEEDWRFGPYD